MAGVVFTHQYGPAEPNSRTPLSSVMFFFLSEKLCTSVFLRLFDVVPSLFLFHQLTSVPKPEVNMVRRNYFWLGSSMNPTLSKTVYDNF